MTPAPIMQLLDLVQTSAALSQTRSRNKKKALLAEVLRRLAPEERAIGASYLAGRLPQGKIGVARSLLGAARETAAAAEPGLSVADVDRAFAELATTTGSGSGARRKQILGGLFSRATAAERDFLGRLIAGGLRQGASEGLLAEGIAAAAEVDADRVRTAIMLAGDLGAVAAAALGNGAAGLDEFRLTLFRPIVPMLAQPAETIADVYGTFDDVALELKLDGARIQAHKDGDEVRIFSRGLRDVTAAIPEVADAVRAIRADSAILDGEAIAMRADGRPHRFQTTMSRFSSKGSSGAGPPLSSYFFDCLRIDGDGLLERPARERFEALEAAVAESSRIARLIPGSREAADEFVDRALESGHEGVMAKSLGSHYRAGARGASWLKLKPAHTLDLVVIAVEWGSGRRRGFLSNLHLGARDPETGTFVMMGKTFKGLTDKLLAWQTEALLAREISRDEWTVYVRPELVVEIALGGVLASPHYPAGLALRFARVKRYRPDKRADQADTVAAVRAIYDADG